MAGRQLAGSCVAWFPCGDDHAAAVRLLPQGVDDELDLIHLAHLPSTAGVLVWVGEPPPVTAVGGFEIAVGIGPGIPNLRVLAEVANVVFPGEIPEQLAQHGRPVDFLGGQQGKSLGQNDGVVDAEARNRVDPRAALLEFAVVENEPHQIQILFHVGKRCAERCGWSRSPTDTSFATTDFNGLAEKIQMIVADSTGRTLPAGRQGRRWDRRRYSGSLPSGATDPVAGSKNSVSVLTSAWRGLVSGGGFGWRAPSCPKRIVLEVFRRTYMSRKDDMCLM